MTNILMFIRKNQDFEKITKRRNIPYKTLRNIAEPDLLKHCGAGTGRKKQASGMEE